MCCFTVDLSLSLQDVTAVNKDQSHVDGKNVKAHVLELICNHLYAVERPTATTSIPHNYVVGRKVLLQLTRNGLLNVTLS